MPDNKDVSTATAAHKKPLTGQEFLEKLTRNLSGTAAEGTSMMPQEISTEVQEFLPGEGFLVGGGSG